jgi:hypothetical protein
MKLLVGIADKTLVTLAKSIDPAAQLITEENWNSNKLPKVGYTGPAEFSNKQNFINLVLSAKELIYDPNILTDKVNLDSPSATNKGLIEICLLLARQENIKVSKFIPAVQSQVEQKRSIYLNLVDQRKPDNTSQLWCVGCSFTHGAGVDIKQRYSTILSQQLNMPLVSLTQVGSSITWAADQILRSDIRSGDIVIWGITEISRFPLIRNNKLKHISISGEKQFEIFEKEYLIYRLTDDENTRYTATLAIEQVTNFCDKIGAHLLLFGILTTATDLMYLNSHPYYYDYSNKIIENFIDRGSDNEHPGPLQHKEYARVLLNKLSDRKII